MTDTAETPLGPVERAPPPRRRRVTLRRSLIGLLIAVLVSSIALGILYLNRRMVAREVLVGWLDRRGIEAQVEVERLEIDGFVGRVSIGDPTNPDVVVERVEVDYAVGLPWSEPGMGVVPSRIRLVRPVVRATWAEGDLSFGSLDPLIEEFRGRPPRPDATAPVVIVEAGALRLGTEYGPLQVLGDARLQDGKLMRLQARMLTASLKSGETEARALGGTLDLTTTDDRVAVTFAAAAEQFQTEAVRADGFNLSGSGSLPYPDLERRRGDGRAIVDLSLAGRALTVGAVSAADATLRYAFDGETAGWLEAFRVQGRSSATLQASRLDAPGMAAADANLSLPGAALRLTRTDGGIGWRLDGPTTLRAGRLRTGEMILTGAVVRSGDLLAGGLGPAMEAEGRLDLAARGFDFGGLSLAGVTGVADLDVVSDGATLVTATGNLRSSAGAWPLFGPASDADVPELVEMKRALGDFSVELPGVRLTTGSPGTQLALTRPARLVPRNGGVLTVSPVARPIFGAEPGERGGGALTIAATRGQGLPEARFDVSDWSLTPGGFRARLDGEAGLDFGVARDLRIRTDGVLANENGRLTYATTTCVPFTAERLDLDENDVTALSGNVCPPNGPLVVVERGAWRASGRLTETAGTAAFLQMAVDEGEGDLVATGSARGLGLQIAVDQARVTDTTEPLRFYPVSASGQVGLAADRWSGAFDLARMGRTLGQVTIRHDGLAQSGGAVIDIPNLSFSPEGLQPSDLTPLGVDIVQSPVTGSAGFSVRFDWSEAVGESSGGTLTIPSLDFTSPAGPVRGLSGTVEFTSLAPNLVTAPNQTLRVASLDAMADLTELDLTFSLDGTALSVAGGTIAAAGGTISVEPLSVPLDRTEAFGGTIVLDRVQLGELVDQAGFGDKVDMDAVVSGRLPFVADPGSGVRITGGSLYAVQPGRLSIQREALSGLEAGGGGEVPPNTVEELAYQAMENLAFDSLSADVNSLDGGRLGVLFKIKGRHDPPERQELRLGVFELLSRRFLERDLPLPSDTGIDLTLDTTLNINQLVSDIMAYNRARAGRPEPEGNEP